MIERRYRSAAAIDQRRGIRAPQARVQEAADDESMPLRHDIAARNALIRHPNGRCVEQIIVSYGSIYKLYMYHGNTGI